MPDNCYWIEETGCFEVCASESLPDLTVGWVQFDSLPDPIVGRTNYTNYPGDSIAPRQVRPAYGNGLIVMGVSYSYGVQPSRYSTDGSHETAGVFVSDDDGFTYSGLIEKFLWLPGGVGPTGYDGSATDYAETVGHWGTDIFFDGTDFFVISQTMNDDNDKFPTMHVSKSGDGLIWSNIQNEASNYVMSQGEAYNGDLWYLGFNTTQNENAPFDPPSIVVGHSDDDGASWTDTQLGEQGGYGTEPWPQYDDISANLDGLHIAASVYDDGSGDYGVYYWRPTGKATWAAPLTLLFNYNTEDINYDMGPSLVASRVNPLNVYMAQPAWSGGVSTVEDYIAFRRSLDGGLTWQAKIPAVILDTDVLGEYFDASLAWNGVSLVELADGRLVIVYVYWGVSFATVAYVVSNSDGADWETPVILGVDDWVSDHDSRGSRINCTARGNDVIITQADRIAYAKAYIIRP